MTTRQYAMTPDVFSSPAIDLMKNDINGSTPVPSFTRTAEKARKSTLSKIPIAPMERRQSRDTAIQSPSPWEMAMDGVDVDVSFTHYVNPLADMDDTDSVDNCVREEGQGRVEGKKVAFEMQTPEAVQILHKISTRVPLSNLNENVLDCYLRTGPKKLSPEPSMEYDILAPRVQQRGGLFAKKKENARIESSEDENNVSDAEEKENVFEASVMEIASPVLERGPVDSPEEIPPTCCPDQAHVEQRRHTVSPVSFNLEASSSGKSKGDSFSFGMGGEHQVTAKLLNAEVVSGGESVDQPNPFASMMGKLRDEPACLKSPIIGNKGHSNTPEDTGESPKSPSHCTPMNLISASGGSKQSLLTGTPELGSSGRLDAWIRHRNLQLNTPTRRDLEKMWDAVRNIRETTEAYQEALKINAQLCEELTELEEAELEARIRAEEEEEIARNEIQKSREISAQMMELSTSMYQEFSRCEEERRSLTAKLEEARQMIRESSQDGVDNITKELENLKEELEAIRKAEALARTEAEEAKSAVCEYEEKLKEAADAFTSMNIEGVDLAGVKSKVEYFETLGEQLSKPVNETSFIQPAKAVEESQPQMEEMKDDVECPATGHRAPQTTPVEINYTTTPYRIFTESMQAFRESMDQSTSEEEEDSGSDYDVEEIPVSPIAADGLTKSTLRETVRNRLLRLRTELEDAKSKLNHVELGLQSKQEGPNPQHSSVVAEKALPEEASCSEKQDGLLKAVNPCVKDTVVECVQENDDARIDDTYLPNNGDADDSEEDEDEFHIPATMATPASARSRFARRFESITTPMSLKRPIFTPNVGMSTMKSTAHYSPHVASTGSSKSPAVFMDSVSRPRARRFGAKSRPSSESAEREFRRRAAAMKIHLSPYFKKSMPMGQNSRRQEIDSVL
jgi:tetratricopeptide (TPR) repeat protein